MTMAVRSLPNTVMTDGEIERLPPLFCEIVKHQRATSEFCSKPIVPFRPAIQMMIRKNELSRYADRMFRPLGGRGSRSA